MIKLKENKNMFKIISMNKLKNKSRSKNRCRNK